MFFAVLAACWLVCIWFIVFVVSFFAGSLRTVALTRLREYSSKHSTSCRQCIFSAVLFSSLTFDIVDDCVDILDIIRPEPGCHINKDSKTGTAGTVKHKLRSLQVTTTASVTVF